MLSVAERVGPWLVEAPLPLEGLGAAFSAQRAEGPSRACTLLVARVEAPAPAAEQVALQVRPLRGLCSGRLHGVLDFGSDKERGLVWVALEPMTGRPLTAWLAEGARAQEEVRVLVQGLTEAVLALRARGVVLGWMSPAQVLMDARGEPRLALVPNVFLGAGSSAQTSRSLRYLPPESFATEVQPSESQTGDLYGIAVFAFEALLGSPAFQVGTGEPMTVQRLAHLKSAAGGLDLGKAFPVALRQAIWLATHRDPGRRPTDPGALLAAFPAPPVAVVASDTEEEAETVRLDEVELPEPEAPGWEVAPSPSGPAGDGATGTGEDSPRLPTEPPSGSDDDPPASGADGPHPGRPRFRNLRVPPWPRVAFVLAVLGGLGASWFLWSRAMRLLRDPSASVSPGAAASGGEEPGADGPGRSSAYVFPDSWRERVSARTWNEANFPAGWLEALAPRAWQALVAGSAPQARSPEPPDPPPGFRTRELRLDPGLRHDGPVHLPGIWAAEEVPFGIPDTWEVWGTPRLRVQTSWSPGLIPQVSALGVWTDGQPSGSFFLGREEAGAASFTVPVTLHAAGGYHRLLFAGYHRSEIPCERKAGEGLWSEVGADSTLILQVRPRPPELNLARWPRPFVDLRDPDDLDMTVVLPPAAGRSALRAAGLTAGALGREAAWHPARIGAHQGLLEDAPAGHLLVFAEVGGDLASAMTAEMLASSEPRVVAAGRALAEGPGPQGGVIALLPRPGDPLHAMLAVVGFDGRGLESLGLLLASRRAAALMEGPILRVGAVEAEAPLPERVWLDTIPPLTSFTLRDMGLGDQMATGFRGGTVTLPIRSIPDERFTPGAGRLDLVYSWSAQADPESSRLYVYANKDLIGSTPLRHLDGRQRQHLVVDIPVQLLGPESTLRVAFDLRGHEDDTCVGAAHSALWGTVHSDTRLTLPRTPWGRLSDLGLLRFGAYPFGLRPDLSETLFVLPTAASPRAVEAYVGLAAALGRKSRGDRLAFDVELRPVDAHTAPGRDLIVIDDADGAPLIETMGLASRYPGDAPEVVQQAVAGPGGGQEPNLILEELPVPWDNERTALTVALAGVLRCGATEDLTLELCGQKAAVASCGEVRAMAGRDAPYSGRLPVKAGVHRWIRRHYWSLVAFAVVLLALSMLVRYRTRTSRRVRAARARDAAGLDSGYM